MNKDMAIEEVRDVRHRISAECGHDLNRFFAMLREEEKEFEPQIRRWREMQNQLQQASRPCQSRATEALELRKKSEG
jgi:hypothetical protein